MNERYPNWMFAGVAIAAYEFSGFLARWTGASGIRWVGYGVVAACAAILGVRYLRTFWSSRKRRRGPKDR
ncbi:MULTISPECIES: hypothetical protein [Alicyclobacillus]|uniref:Uncharacterized protein n=1 Tax=Alicyclobacillus acidocaldarius subsp. acidocaldarius (strain ATCC 27009 / DSM 446 / BCRC 14685 / JCM 5260 / KCTC 1825 / NBRC 15652 / NCIMB 11725 / NRRL B-14509 / 104-IA) TaxID=521098 RepID=C8WXR3_ALIAD|nr:MULTISPECIES: hypothetical protein [Alicyclobacillus]ACV58884.1 hypothetical protein Aaci_1872 [Alicyclobacillus acidocaldarius subsp. acidocaldarius DSM 446]